MQSVTVDGGAYTYSTQTINSTNVAFVSIPAGNHSVTAVYGSSGKLPQTITFNSLPDKVYGDPSVHSVRDGDVGLDGDVHGERGVHQLRRQRCHGDGDRSGQLHGDGASAGQRDLRSRAGRAADVQHRQSESDDHLCCTAGQDVWRPAVHGCGDGDVGLAGDVHGEWGVHQLRRQRCHGDG